MSNPPPPAFVRHAVLEENASYAVRLDWTNPVTYDKIIVAWGPGNTEDAPSPNTFEPSADATNYTIHGFQPGSTWVVKIEGGTADAFGVSYSGWVAAVVTFPVFPQLLLYRTTGVTFATAILSGTRIGGPHLTNQIGTWDSNWTQLVPFALGGQRFLLWYKQADGSVWMAPLVDDVDGDGLSGVAHAVRTVDLENKPLDWGSGWTHVVATVAPFSSSPFVLLYAPPDNSGQGGGRNAFLSAPIVSPTQIGNQTVVTLGKGVQDQDWAQIVPFVFDNDHYLLFYNRSTGNAYTAPVMSETQIGDLTPIGTWETDWDLMTSFVIEAGSFLLLYKRNGDAWTTPFSSSTHVPNPTQIGGAGGAGKWETDWALIVPFNN